MPGIETCRLRWAGHIQRMNEDEIIKSNGEGKTRVGKRKKKWIDGQGILQAVKFLKINKSLMATRSGEVWIGILMGN